MVPLLCEAGADPNTTKDHKGRTALAFVLREVLKAQISCGVTAPVGMKTHWSELDTLELVRALLRSGAQLDAIENSGDSSLEYPFVDDQGRFVRGPLSAESILRSYDCFIPYEHTNTSQLPEIKRLVAGVRAAKGSYARYAKKEILVLLALVRKGRAATTWFYAGDHRTAFDVLAFSFGISVGSAGAGGYYDSRPRTPTLNVEDFDNDALSIEDEEEFDFDEGEFVIE